MKPKIIAFDADDTLFVNEPYFQETEQKFCAMMSDYLSKQGLSQELFKTEVDNLHLYVYGIKGYTLSMIEAAMKISNNTLSVEVIGLLNPGLPSLYLKDPLVIQMFGS